MEFRSTFTFAARVLNAVASACTTSEAELVSEYVKARQIGLIDALMPRSHREGSPTNRQSGWTSAAVGRRCEIAPFSRSVFVILYIKKSRLRNFILSSRVPSETSQRDSRKVSIASPRSSTD